MDNIFINSEGLKCEVDNLVNIYLSDHNTLVSKVDLANVSMEKVKKIKYSKSPETMLGLVSCRTRSLTVRRLGPVTVVLLGQTIKRNDTQLPGRTFFQTFSTFFTWQTGESS